MTVTVEVIQNRAYDLLSDMERLDLIRISAPAKNIDIHEKKLSERFAGALHLSDDRYEECQNTLREGRNEWLRTIY